MVRTESVYGNVSSFRDTSTRFTVSCLCCLVFSYLAAGASFDAAKVISRKNDISSLRTAASVARISGEATLAASLALRCAKDLAAALDWTGAQEVLSSQESLLVSGGKRHGHRETSSCRKLKLDFVTLS